MGHSVSKVAQQPQIQPTEPQGPREPLEDAWIGSRESVDAPVQSQASQNQALQVKKPKHLPGIRAAACTVSGAALGAGVVMMATPAAPVGCILATGGLIGLVLGLVWELYARVKFTRKTYLQELAYFEDLAKTAKSISELDRVKRDIMNMKRPADTDVQFRAAIGLCSIRHDAILDENSGGNPVGAINAVQADLRNLEMQAKMPEFLEWACRNESALRAVAHNKTRLTKLIGDGVDLLGGIPRIYRSETVAAFAILLLRGLNNGASLRELKDRVCQVLPQDTAQTGAPQAGE